ncbi:MAG: hypothetical protein LBT70_00200 [Holosporaceae bacterium]|jgi:cell division protein FtsL|nr:hypothetical protein [Holosporaceae bacterium]
MVAKKTTIFFIVLVFLAGSWMFYLKYSVISIEDKIKIAQKEILREKKNQHILKAEWKSLTSPERIQNLALRHLDLKQIEPHQLKEFDPSLFHGDKNSSPKSEKLSKLVNEIISQLEP